MNRSLRASQVNQMRVSATPFRGPMISVRFLPEDDLRYTVVVRKAMGTAVQRNRLKRRLRERMRLQSDRIPRGWYLLYVNRPFETFDIAGADDDLAAALRSFRGLATGAGHE